MRSVESANLQFHLNAVPVAYFQGGRRGRRGFCARRRKDAYARECSHEFEQAAERLSSLERRARGGRFAEPEKP